MHLVWTIIAITSFGTRHSSAFVSQNTLPSHKGNHRLYKKDGVRIATTTTIMTTIDPNNGDEDRDETDTNPIVENDSTRYSFLEQAIFDPEDPSNENNWFANLVKNDYYTAEALYAGVIVIIGVIVAQDMLRIVKYGGDSAPGKLF